MRIGIFMADYLPAIGGAQICTHCLANSFVKKNEKVFVYAFRYQVEACRKLGWRFDYELVGINTKPFWLMNRISWLWLHRRMLTAIMVKQALLNKLDVIQIIVAWPWLPAVKEVSKATGIPVVLRCAGDDIQIDHTIGYGIRRDDRTRKSMESGFESVSCGIAISPTVTEEYIKAGISRENIVEIPPGIDWESYQRLCINPQNIRAKWGIPPDKRMIISVGRNHPKKGFEDLLKALSILNRKDQRFVVVIVGNDSEKLMTAAQKLQVSHVFYPIPNIQSEPNDRVGSFPSKTLIELYKASNYFVLPSYIETYANVALEAMAAGIPAIVTRVPGCVDTITDRLDGLIVRAGSPYEIAEKILLLEDDNRFRNQIIENGFKKAKKQDWDIIAAQYLETYRHLCENRRSNFIKSPNKRAKK